MKYINIFVLLTGLTLPLTAHAFRPDQGDGWGPTAASNVESVRNTRHNLTVEYASWRAFMNPYFNNYGEVCVYCHTPHGANGSAQGAPLWNRAASTAEYTLYSQGNLPISGPGPNSVTCLSCHDGTIAIDAIINMPGRGGYDPTHQMDEAFLDSWAGDIQHQTMSQCTQCHYRGNGWSIPDLGLYTVGPDLSNDHPIGVVFPTAGDFAVPSGMTPGGMQFFDRDGDNRADPNEIRLYDSGEGHEVECASCHDPHGVMDPNGGSTFIASFLRVRNENSALCFTCHNN